VSLREKQAALLARTVESLTGYGWPVTVTNPAGVSASLVGLVNDIGSAVDLDTGLTVGGRTASVALRLASLSSLGTPIGVADGTLKPWIVEFETIDGVPREYKVTETRPDLTLGLVVCALELYE
jgi:hypothetical protein